MTKTPTPRKKVTRKGQANPLALHYKSVKYQRTFGERWRLWKSTVWFAWMEIWHALRHFPESESHEYVRCKKDDPDKLWTMTTSPKPARYEIVNGEWQQVDPVI